MKLKRFLPAAAFLLVFLLHSGVLSAQTAADVGNDEARHVYSQEELDTLLAPIALYPDSLLSQILMASTYPLEVVEADRWLRKNPNLPADRLDDALKEKSWDASVKSLCYYPKTLATMSDRLDNTQALGNAFLAQQDQVMDTIQSLRAKARQAGHLESSDRERVIVDDNYTTIEPVNPEVVYIPFYDPCRVYGPWWYPSCAPAWFWWPDIVVGAGFFWGPPIFVGPIGLWCGFHWRQHDVFVDIGRTIPFYRPEFTRRHGGIETWRHNPIHRRGVIYNNPRVAREFGSPPRPGIEARRAFRGFPSVDSGTLRPSSPGRTDRTGESAIRPPGPSPVRPGRDQLTAPQRTVPPHLQEPGRTVSPPAARSAQPDISPFEGFGRSGSVTRQNSQRGFESMRESPGSIREGGFRQAVPGGGDHAPVQGGFSRGGPHGRDPHEGGRR